MAKVMIFIIHFLKPLFPSNNFKSIISFSTYHPHIVKFINRILTTFIDTISKINLVIHYPILM